MDSKKFLEEFLGDVHVDMSDEYITEWAEKLDELVADEIALEVQEQEELGDL